MLSRDKKRRDARLFEEYRFKDIDKMFQEKYYMFQKSDKMFRIKVKIVQKKLREINFFVLYIYYQKIPECSINPLF
jgi:hypothetical protein